MCTKRIHNNSSLIFIFRVKNDDTHLSVSIHLLNRNSSSSIGSGLTFLQLRGVWFPHVSFNFLWVSSSFFSICKKCLYVHEDANALWVKVPKRKVSHLKSTIALVFLDPFLVKKNTQKKEYDRGGFPKCNILKPVL